MVEFCRVEYSEVEPWKSNVVSSRIMKRNGRVM